MKNWPYAIGGLVIGVIAVLLYWQSIKDLPPVALPPPPAASVPAPAPQPAIRYPITAVTPEVDDQTAQLELDQPLPSLAESDTRMGMLLARLFASQKLDQYFVLEHFIERCVVMIDSLPRDQLPASHRPVKKVEGRFAVQTAEGRMTIDPGNYQRYEPIIALLEHVDRKQVVAVYVALYPLFQEAYEKLGYPNDYFNDRLIEVVDHLLGAPQVADPIYLSRPQALYEYAEADLEAESAGRKLLIRTGPANAARLKSLLKSYRKDLVAAETPR